MITDLLKYLLLMFVSIILGLIIGIVLPNDNRCKTWKEFYNCFRL